ncbi:MAG TPA: hypothetical protein VNK51_11705 [Bradyrhizobium sp.]|nr:hypothetical protein [Bradyrhizobium sp.]
MSDIHVSIVDAKVPARAQAVNDGEGGFTGATAPGPPSRPLR